MSHKIDNRILELLQKADWEDIIPRLMKYAKSKLSIRTGSPLDGISINEVAHDIVNNSIKKVIEGKRKWDPERGSLLKFLKFSVIRSDVNHLYKSDYYDLTQRMPDSQEDCGNAPINTTEFVDARDSILKAVEGDDELTDIVLCILEGVDKPKDIANHLNVDTKVINNARKRLQRIYRNILSEKK